MTEDADVPLETVAKVRSVCIGLPEAYEEQAWVGTRWRIRKRTFAHVLMIDAGWPPAYALAAGSDGPIGVITFRSSGLELDALSNMGHPFFKPRWLPDIVGMVLDAGVDWDEVAELITESYCILAPKKLVEAIPGLQRLDEPRLAQGRAVEVRLANRAVGHIAGRGVER